MNNLDDSGALAAADPGGMIGMVAGLPEQLARGAVVRSALGASAGPVAAPVSRPVLVCGMGGSAIGGDMAAAWAATHGVRVAVHRGYGLPAWAGRETLVLFSSYSGNTEETLSAFDAAAAHGADRRSLATGGALAVRARAAGAPLVEIPSGGLQPRAALGHSLVAQLVQLHHAGVLPDPVADLERSAAHLRTLAGHYSPNVPEASNPAKRLARRWHEHLPVIYTGSGCMQPVGVRWRGQINENAKSLAVASVLPELDHNEIMGWTALPEVRRRVALVFLRDAQDAGAVDLRMRVTSEILAPRVGAVEWIESAGDTVLERMLGAAWLGDWASLYLAFLYGVDPTPVAEIDVLKSRLAAAAAAAQPA